MEFVSRWIYVESIYYCTWSMMPVGISSHRHRWRTYQPDLIHLHGSSFVTVTLVLSRVFENIHSRLYHKQFTSWKINRNSYESNTIVQINRRKNSDHETLTISYHRDGKSRRGDSIGHFSKGTKGEVVESYEQIRHVGLTILLWIEEKKTFNLYTKTGQ